MLGLIWYVDAEGDMFCYHASMFWMSLLNYLIIFVGTKDQSIMFYSEISVYSSRRIEKHNLAQFFQASIWHIFVTLGHIRYVDSEGDMFCYHASMFWMS